MRVTELHVHPRPLDLDLLQEYQMPNATAETLAAATGVLASAGLLDERGFPNTT